MSSLAEFAFADALLALEELDHTEIADRLRARWPEVGTPTDDALVAENQQLRDALLLLTDNAEAYLNLEQDGERNYPDSLRLCIDEARTALGETPSRTPYLDYEWTPSAAQTLEEPQPTKGTGSS